ncbi:chromosome partitioning protein ParB, partial [Streptomyces diastaticus]
PRKPEDYYGVIEPSPEGATAILGTDADNPAPSRTSDAESSPPSNTAGPQSLGALLVQVGGAGLMDAVREHLSDDERSTMLHRYFMVSSGVQQVATDLGRGLPPAHRAELGRILQQVAELLTEK